MAMENQMTLGIRHTVSLSEPSFTATKTTSKESQSNYTSFNELDESDTDDNELESQFLETNKYEFLAEGSETTPAHRLSDFKFKDYCPQIFRQLREWFGILTEEYLVTICGDYKLLEFISNSKSGSFFFFSYNSQFIIKTMTRSESIFLRKFLPSYYTYVSQQPDTLLPKFYGMHRVKTKNQKTIYFFIQQNVFYTDVDIHVQYDLKGSTQGRQATQTEREKGANAILKDLDWINEKKIINIGCNRAKLFKDQLRRDTQWLRIHKIMDYSLLVGIHDRNPSVFKIKPRQIHKRIDKVIIDYSNGYKYVFKASKSQIVEEDENEVKHGQLSDTHLISNVDINKNNETEDICPWTMHHGGMVSKDDGNSIYFVGLIDILQKYNKRKKLENWIKTMKYDQISISAAPPNLYRQRMCDFFEDKVI